MAQYLNLWPFNMTSTIVAATMASELLRSLLYKESKRSSGCQSAWASMYLCMFAYSSLVGSKRSLVKCYVVNTLQWEMCTRQVLGMLSWKASSSSTSSRVSYQHVCVCCVSACLCLHPVCQPKTSFDPGPLLPRSLLL